MPTVADLIIQQACDRLSDYDDECKPEQIVSRISFIISRRAHWEGQFYRLRDYAKHKPDCRKGSRADMHPQATFGHDCSCGLDEILYAVAP